MTRNHQRQFVGIGCSTSGSARVALTLRNHLAQYRACCFSFCSHGTVSGILYPFNEQVSEHPDFRDGERDDQETVDCPAKFRNQERRDYVQQVGGAPYHEHDAERPWKHL